MIHLPPGFSRFTLPLGGMTYDVIEAGPRDGALVLFLHGWPSFASSWRAVMAPVAAAGYRAVAIDQRGYSRGARPPEIADYKVDHLVADADNFARALAGTQKFHLVGHDWGGIVAWVFGALHPARLASLTVLSTPHAGAYAQALASDAAQQEMTSYIKVFRKPGHVAEAALLRNDAAKLRAIYQNKCLPGEIEENLARLSEPGALTAVLNWYRALDNSLLGRPVAVPALYIWGSLDMALGRTAAEATGKFVTGPYQFAALEGMSHWLAEEAPEAVTQLLLAHLAKFQTGAA